MICLIDPSLKDHVGHYYQYAASLHQYAFRRGLELLILGHVSVSGHVRRMMPVQPVFRYEFHTQFAQTSSRCGLYYDFLRANLEFYRDLKKGLKQCSQPPSFLFMSMVDHRQLLGWAWWVGVGSHLPWGTVVLMFRLSYFHANPSPDQGRRVQLARIGFKALEAAAGTGRLRIATDSERLADEYSRLTRLPIEVFPIPHTDYFSADSAEEGPIPQPPKVRFVMLGDAREEKGFPVLISAIERLWHHPLFKEMEFVIQCNIGSHWHAPMERYRQILEVLNLPNVRLVKESLGPEAYCDLVKSSDVVLLPYDQKTYYSRTSGPLVEAFAAGKPVIVTAGTWMSDQLAKFGGGRTFRDGDSDDLARAIVDVYLAYPDHACRALAGRPGWVGYHNPASFFQILLGSAPAVPPSP